MKNIKRSIKRYIDIVRRSDIYIYSQHLQRGKERMGQNQQLEIMAENFPKLVR